ncbi:hemerythrin domain-containing protein [Novosphingobium huizhouense]|uniref:hemerythrin domain-containing protein n=1 Tax=Novosphingobium huizhouense TaxID=2866625 RepID=UPI001CD8DD88|nr:hemerythrin domain-containing protein [Novosphingobium huizhouense]
MSFLDRIAAKIMPPETEEDRQRARAKAESMAQGRDWLGLALEHHRRIEASFALVAAAATAEERTSALKQLALVLNGHAGAEETVLYPALTEHGEKTHATMAYEEQAMTKIEMARLEKLDPESREWAEKLEHIRGAVLHHIYEEENDWFPALRAAVPATDDALLTQRFAEEFERYAGKGERDLTRGAPQQMTAQMDESNRQPSANWGAADY